MSNIINNLAGEIANQEMLSTPNFNDWNCGHLTDYIIQTHHEYVIKTIPEILAMAQKVVEAHGTKHAELATIQSLFQQLSNEMLLHMKKEELVLFPYIKKLAQAESDEKGVERPDFGSITTPISVMETEHETAGIMLKRLSKLSNNYTPPNDACNTFRLFFAKLKEFEADLHTHVHLENNILFPKTIALEQSLLVG
ncbi:hemerythrin domain-containing protein [bacterium]|nr:hemerythrin domain-containing protein [bacterium]